VKAGTPFGRCSYRTTSIKWTFKTPNKGEFIPLMAAEEESLLKGAASVASKKNWGN
jgi:hypothetical protein